MPLIFDANETIIEMMRYFSEYPIVLAVMIVIATFILEDGATIGASLLALEGFIDPQLALGALIFGIAVGDLGLYGLGSYAAGHPRVLKLIGEKRLEKGRRYLDQRLTVALIMARCLPGMRMPTYVTSGLLRVNFIKFSLVAIVMASLWASFFFWAILSFGRLIVDQIGSNMWIVGVILLFVMIFLPRAYQKRHPLDGEEESE